MEKTDLQKAFACSRGRPFGAYQSGRNRGMITTPTPAAIALQKARGLIAALPALEEQEAAAREALEAQRAIDGRRYASGMEAARAGLETARKALQAGRAWKYARPVWTRGYRHNGPRDLAAFYCEDGGPLRNIQEAGAFLDSRAASSFYTDSDCSETCGGYIAQLPSRKGRARFVAGYGFSVSGGGACFNLSDIFESDFEAERDSARRQIGKSYWTPEMEAPGYWAESAHDTARKEAARRAADLAKSAAEKEREYQTAWHAGQAWADLKAEEEAARTEARAILAERRAAMNSPAVSDSGFFALCDAIRGRVRALVDSIAESRARRRELAEGDDSQFMFWNGEERLRAAFCDGAGLDKFPA